MAGAGFSFIIVLTLLKPKFISFNASAISSYSSSLLNISLFSNISSLFIIVSLLKGCLTNNPFEQ